MGQSMQEEWSEESLAGGSKRSSVALSSNSTPTYIRKAYVPPETLTQRSPSMFHEIPKRQTLRCNSLLGPERESKATGYSVADKQEHDRHSMKPVQERGGSYSSSRYINRERNVVKLPHIIRTIF